MEEVNNVNNQFIEIGDNILNRINKEISKFVRYKAYSRIDVSMKNINKNQILWLVERTGGDISYQRDIVGNIRTVVSEFSQTNTLNDKSFGLEVSKNSPVGILLDKYDFLNHVVIPNNFGHINSKSHYIPAKNDALSGAIYLSLENIMFFSELKAELEKLKNIINEKEQKIKELEDSENKELIEKLTNELDIIKKEYREIEEKQRKRKRHIIDNQTLRLQPKLDGDQIDIKSKAIFDKNILIIDGGPGTGKTTTLIDRINFLTDKSIIEFVNLSDNDYNKVIDPNQSYLLFTPNELLMFYLEQAMNSKGLSANRDKVKIWNDFKFDLLNEQGFGFLKGQSKDSPFIQYKKRVDKFFEFSKESFGEFLSMSNIKFIEFLNKRHLKITNLDEQILNTINNKKIVTEIRKKVQKLSQSKSIDEWLSFYIQINKYKKELGINNKELETILSSLADKLVVKIKAKSVNLYAEIETEILKNLSNQKSEIEDDEEIDEDNNEIEKDNIKETVRVLNRLKQFIRNIATITYDTNYNLNPLDKSLKEKIGNLVDDKDFAKIAQKRLFQKYFSQIIAGVESNTLKTIPNFYKFFRINYLLPNKEKFINSNANEIFDLLIYGDSIKRDDKVFLQHKNNRITSEETDFIIYLVLNIIRKIHTIDKNYYTNSKNSFIEYYKYINKHIVAIDEATDFSALQLACMSMLSNPDFNCITLSGDLMQRMTNVGIQNWKEFELIFPNIIYHTLNNCYRQSYKLLELTKLIYRNSTKQEPLYYSNYEFSVDDPFPLYIKSENVDDKIEWLANRILDIRENYEESKVTPTIAIFVDEDSVIDLLYEKLTEQDILSNIKIEPCKDGKVLGSGSNFRIFNVKYIKGLEFEAVFFFDIDKIETKFPDILDKILYVGLSRASLYLGVTMQNYFPLSLKYLENEFKLVNEYKWKK